jgi:hypothetical protein
MSGGNDSANLAMKEIERRDSAAVPSLVKAFVARLKRLFSSDTGANR